MIEPSDRVSFYEDMALGLKDGGGVQEIVKDIHFFYRETGNPLFLMTEEIQKAIANGRPLSNVLRRWFPDEDVFLVASAEEKGLDATVFEDLIGIINEKERLKSVFKKELTPKLTMLFFILLFIVGFSAFLIPGFAEMISEKDMTPTIRYYFGFGDFIINYGVLVASTLGAIGVGIYISIHKLIGPLRDKLDQYSPWSIYREFQSASFLVVLSGMMKAGIPTDKALELLSSRSNPYIKYHISKIRHRLAVGNSKEGNEGGAFNTGFFSKITSYKIAAYSKRSGLGEGLYLLGSRSAKDLSKSMEGIAKTIGKFIGAFAFGYIAATGAAMYDIIMVLLSGVM